MTKTYRGGTMKRAARNVLVAMLVLGGAVEAGTVEKVGTGATETNTVATGMVFFAVFVLVAEIAVYVASEWAMEKAIEAWWEKRDEKVDM